MVLEETRVYVIFMVLTSLILLAFGAYVVSRRQKVPGRLQTAVEMMMDYLRGTFMGSLGPGGERHLPLIFALFWYIIFCNLIELIPGFHAATSNPSNTIGLGIIVFVYSQYVGITSKGLVNYLKHFMGPLLLLAPLFVVIEIIGECVKPFSLGMRLFGNIYAEDVMNTMAAKAIPIGPHGHALFYVPFQLIVYPIQIFTGAIQAYIFALLACAYIGLMAEHHDESGDSYDPHPHHESENEALSESMGSVAGRVASH